MYINSASKCDIVWKWVKADSPFQGPELSDQPVSLEFINNSSHSASVTNKYELTMILQWQRTVTRGGVKCSAARTWSLDPNPEHVLVIPAGSESRGT